MLTTIKESQILSGLYDAVKLDVLGGEFEPRWRCPAPTECTVGSMLGSGGVRSERAKSDSGVIRREQFGCCFCHGMLEGGYP